MIEKRHWPIDEFVSFELKENKKKGEFTIILSGKLNFSDLIAVKGGEITVTKEVMVEYLE